MIPRTRFGGGHENWWQHSESRLESMQEEIDAWMFSAGVSGHARSLCNDQGPSAATVTGHLGHASRAEELSPFLSRGVGVQQKNSLRFPEGDITLLCDVEVTMNLILHMHHIALSR